MMLATVSCVVHMVANAKANVVVKMKASTELNMKTAIKTMCVVAGTALPGRSGDRFPTLQGKSIAWCSSRLSDIGVSA